MTGWSDKHDASADEIRLWEKLYPYDNNTGVITRNVPLFDIDVLLKECGDAVEAMVREFFEERGELLTRVGLAPKRGLAFRTDEPFSKLSVVFETPEGATSQRLEFLGNGQQFVAYGVHPDTGQPYRWHARELAAVSREDLPYIREADARDLLERATKIALDFGYRLRGDGAATGNGSARPKRERSESQTFFQRVNTHALEFIEPWAKALFPKAHYQKGTGAWRVSSKDLGRSLEEDLSLHPDGIWDFGTERPYTAIDLVREYRAIQVLPAALWLCERMSINPTKLGYTERSARPPIRPEVAMKDDTGTPGRNDQARKYDGPSKTDHGIAEQGAARLAFVNIAAWAEREPPDREWAVPERFPLRNVALFSGEGSTGKSILLMQLGAAHVLGKDWALTLPEPGPFLYLNAEDEEDELERRLSAIAKHYRAPVAELARDYHIVSRFGQDAVLAYPDRHGQIRPTPLFEELKQAAHDIHPKLIGLDTSADIFGGNEIDRSQVRQFISLMRGLAIAGNSAVLIALHPSLTGISSGTGLSGSTAWHNSVRARAYLTSEPTEDGTDSGLRQLDFKKNNYGPISASVTLQWKAIGKAGVYLPVSSGSPLDKAAADKKAEHIFIDLLRRFEKQGRDVSHKKGPSYAPAQFADEDLAQKLAPTDAKRRKALKDAMTRLFASKKIRTDNYGRPSRPHNKIVEQEQENPA
jgi:RecA-family ATPase